MISWMQRHRKYLVITIWVSTIAFIGAGFVGWGQYSYGDKASAIAKVGDISLSQHNFQQAYSRLYGQYSQLFGGNFDEARAKEFGLEQQALKTLIDGALLLNLAKTYGLQINDDELLAEITSQSYFFKDGAFDKETYQKVLSQNRLTMKEYETDTRNAMLTKKIMEFFASNALPLEQEAFLASENIRDRISYKVLSSEEINIEVNDTLLKPYWEPQQFSYMTQPAYTFELLKTAIEPSNPTADAIESYYADNKHAFKDAEGKILSLEAARAEVIAALDDKAANKNALKRYIAYKKGELTDAQTQTLTIDENTNPYKHELFDELVALTPENPLLKPRKIGDHYVTFKLLSTQPARPKTFEEAKHEVAQQYVSEQKQQKLLEIASASQTNFTGNTTDFIGIDDVSSITALKAPLAGEFLQKLFQQTNKQGYVTLSNQNVVLYAILEQKMLQESLTDKADSVMSSKSMILDRGLIKLLETQYPTEIYVKGL